MVLQSTSPETLIRHLCRHGSAETFGLTASVFDDNLIDGHDPTDSLILAFIYCISISVTLSCQNDPELLT